MQSQSRSNTPEKVIIIGAGLSGLICAHHLQKAGIQPMILEASDAVGGRMRTDPVDGFILDRGFQVMLQSYPWTREFLNLEHLHLKPFKSGALIWSQAKLHRLVDPRQSPWRLPELLTSPLLSWGDKLRMGRLALDVLYHSAKDNGLNATESYAHLSTSEYLTKLGFTQKARDGFFRPFFSGIFLEKDLETRASFFRFLFRMFATGPAVVPATGMGEICKQLAKSLLRENCIRLNTPAAEVRSDRSIVLVSGEVLTCDAVVLATPPSVTARFISDHSPITEPHWHKALTLYYSAPKSPLRENILVLNGEKEGLINHLAVMSDVSSLYAPKGRALIAANATNISSGDEASWDREAREQLKSWFGSQVDSWKLLKSYSIEQALPSLSAASASGSSTSPLRLPEGVFVCGDAWATPSQDGAARSGSAASEAVQNFLLKT